MPFTLVHPAAVLPLARTPLVPSALVLGSMAPDLPYYVSLQWLGGDYNLTLTHAATSLLWLDPLIALVLLAVFQVVLKRPLLALLPVRAAERAWPAAQRFTWRGPAALGWIAASAVVGAATHLAWDALDDVLGHAWSSRLDAVSGVVGGAVLLAWARRWWRATRPQPLPAGLLLGARQRIGVLVALAAVAVVSGVVEAAGVLPQVQEDLRAMGAWSRGAVTEHALRAFVVDAATALGAAVVAYALAWHLLRALRRRHAERAAPAASTAPVAGSGGRDAG